MTHQDVSRLLTSLWPDVIVHTPARPMKVRALAWESKNGPHGWFGGSVDETGRCLFIEIGDYEDIARLAFHVRQELAPDQGLLLYRESLDEIIPLEGKSMVEIRHTLTGEEQ